MLHVHAGGYTVCKKIKIPNYCSAHTFLSFKPNSFQTGQDYITCADITIDAGSGSGGITTSTATSTKTTLTTSTKPTSTSSTTTTPPCATATSVAVTF